MLFSTLKCDQYSTDFRKTVNEAYEKLLTVVNAEMDKSLNYKDTGLTRLKNRSIWVNQCGMTTSKIYGIMWDAVKSTT